MTSSHPPPSPSRPPRTTERRTHSGSPLLGNCKSRNKGHRGWRSGRGPEAFRITLRKSPTELQPVLPTDIVRRGPRWLPPHLDAIPRGLWRSHLCLSEQVVPVSALVALLNLLDEKMLTFFISESWIKLSYLKLGHFRLEALRNIVLSQELASSWPTCFLCERGSTSDSCYLARSVCLLVGSSVLPFPSPPPSPCPRWDSRNGGGPWFR